VFGLPVEQLWLTSAVVTLTGILSAEAFGRPTQEFVVREFVQVVTSNGISTDEAFGSPSAVYVPATIQPAGVPSRESFGIPSQALVLTS
jgi:hypothetical protein